jgi:hypothetical protein
MFRFSKAFQQPQLGRPVDAPNELLIIAAQIMEHRCPLGKDPISFFILPRAMLNGAV